MIGVFYIAFSACLIVFQTVVRPAVPALGNLYDLLIPVIVYFSLFRPARETVLAVFCLGFVMDNLSGGPFGLYLTSYLWLFIALQWMIRYLRVSNTLLLPPIVAGGVLIENLVFLGTLALMGRETHLPQGVPGKLTAQIVWALLTGTFLVSTMAYGAKRLKKWTFSRMGATGPEDE